MASTKIVGILLIAAGLVAGWFGVPHGQPNKATLGLAGALIAAGAYALWNSGDEKKKN